MKRKLLAVAYSDIHFNIWQRFWNHNGTTRLEWSIKAHKEIRKVATQHSVPTLFCGDMFHKPKALENSLMADLMPYLIESYSFNRPKEFAISGNHDQSRHNFIDNPAESYIQTLVPLTNTLQCIDMKVVEYKGMTLVGIPYLSYNLGMKESIEKALDKVSKKSFSILMIHCDIPKAVTSVGYQFDDVQNFKGLNKLFKKFDLVLNGHIHKPQQLPPNVHILGSPIHQDAGDAGTVMGYYKIYSDKTIEFVPLEGFPEFKKIPVGTKAPDNFHYYVPEGQSDSEVAQMEIPSVNFSTNKARIRLAKRYLKANKVKSKTKKEALIRYLTDDKD